MTALAQPDRPTPDLPPCDIHIRTAMQARFADRLHDSKTRIAQHALAAWDGETAEQINGTLIAARTELEQIATDAAATGFPDLGRIAAQCVQEINAHLHGPYADLAICPGVILWRIDSYIASCDTIHG